MNEITTPSDSPADPRGAAAEGPASTQGRLAARVVWAAVLATYPLVLLACLWRAEPGRGDRVHLVISFGVFMLRTFSFQAGLAMAFVAAIAAWRRAKRLALVAAFPALVALAPAVPDFLPQSVPATDGPSIRVMHYNLLHSNDNVQDVADEIIRNDPDILVLLEYDPAWSRGLEERLTGRFNYGQAEPQVGSFGWAVFSRLPLEDRFKDFVPREVDNLTIIRSVVRIENRPIALYVVHLNPPKGMSMLVSQGAGLNRLASVLADETLPVIVCGDYNFTSLHRMAGILTDQGLTDAHAQAGWGRGSTWPTDGVWRFLPGVRIDHIYLRGGPVCTSIRTGPPHGSDHRPVIAEIGFARNSLSE